MTDSRRVRSADKTASAPRPRRDLACALLAGVMYALSSFVAAAAPTLQFDVLAQVVRSDGSRTVLTVADGGVLRTGDEVQFRVRTSVDAYVYIVAYGSSGSAVLVHPYSGDPASAFVRAGSERVFPDPTIHLPLDQRSGRELFLAIASPTPLAQPSRLLVRIEGARGDKQQIADIVSREATTFAAVSVRHLGRRPLVGLEAAELPRSHTALPSMDASTFTDADQPGPRVAAPAPAPPATLLPENDPYREDEVLGGEGSKIKALIPLRGTAGDAGLTAPRREAPRATPPPADESRLGKRKKGFAATIGGWFGFGSAASVGGATGEDAPERNAPRQDQRPAGKSHADPAPVTGRTFALPVPEPASRVDVEPDTATAGVLPGGAQPSTTQLSGSPPDSAGGLVAEQIIALDRNGETAGDELPAATPPAVTVERIETGSNKVPIGGSSTGGALAAINELLPPPAEALAGESVASRIVAPQPAEAGLPRRAGPAPGIVAKNPSTPGLVAKIGSLLGGSGTGAPNDNDATGSTAPAISAVPAAEAAVEVAGGSEAGAGAGEVPGVDATAPLESLSVVDTGERTQVATGNPPPTRAAEIDAPTPAAAAPGDPTDSAGASNDGGDSELPAESRSIGFSDQEPAPPGEIAETADSVVVNPEPVAEADPAGSATAAPTADHTAPRGTPGGGGLAGLFGRLFGADSADVEPRKDADASQSAKPPEGDTETTVISSTVEVDLGIDTARAATPDAAASEAEPETPAGWVAPTDELKVIQAPTVETQAQSIALQAPTTAAAAEPAAIRMEVESNGEPSSDSVLGVAAAKPDALASEPASETPPGPVASTGESKAIQTPAAESVEIGVAVGAGSGPSSDSVPTITAPDEKVTSEDAAAPESKKGLLGLLGGLFGGARQSGDETADDAPSPASAQAPAPVEQRAVGVADDLAPVESSARAQPATEVTVAEDGGLADGSGTLQASSPAPGAADAAAAESKDSGGGLMATLRGLFGAHQATPAHVAGQAIAPTEESTTAPGPVQATAAAPRRPPFQRIRGTDNDRVLIVTGTGAPEQVVAPGGVLSGTGSKIKALLDGGASGSASTKTSRTETLEAAARSTSSSANDTTASKENAVSRPSPTVPAVVPKNAAATVLDQATEVAGDGAKPATVAVVAPDAVQSILSGAAKIPPPVVTEAPIEAVTEVDLNAGDNAAMAVVLVSTPNGAGAGALLDKQGRVLTLWHLVRGYTDVAVVFKAPDGGSADRERAYRARVVKLNRFSDLALLQIEPPPPEAVSVRLAAGNTALNGAIVHAIGPGPDGSWRHVLGRVAQIRPGSSWYSGQRILHRGTVLRAKVLDEPGSAGAPLFNNRMELIGIGTEARSRRDRLSAVAIDTIQRFLAVQPGQQAVAGG